MDQGGRLKRVAFGLAGHLMRRHFSEFIINERQQIMDSLRVAFFRPFQESRDFAHIRSGKEEGRLQGASALADAGLWFWTARPAFEISLRSANRMATDHVAAQ